MATIRGNLRLLKPFDRGTDLGLNLHGLMIKGACRQALAKHGHRRDGPDAEIESGLDSNDVPLQKWGEYTAKEAEAARRAQTMPGVGPITGLAIKTFALDLNCFRRGRDCAGWLGLLPKQTSTGGRPRLGKTSKIGQRDIRRLLISGEMAVVQAIERYGRPYNGWIISMLERKPRMPVAVALANKMARGLWATVTKQ